MSSLVLLLLFLNQRHIFSACLEQEETETHSKKEIKIPAEGSKSNKTETQFASSDQVGKSGT